MDAALTLLGSLVDLVERGEVRLAALGLGEHASDGSGKGGLTVVNVTNRTNVHMRLTTFKLLLGHCRPPLATVMALMPLYVQRRRSAA